MEGYGRKGTVRTEGETKRRRKSKEVENPITRADNYDSNTGTGKTSPFKPMGEPLSSASRKDEPGPDEPSKTEHDERRVALEWLMDIGTEGRRRERAEENTAETHACKRKQEGGKEGQKKRTSGSRETGTARSNPS